MGKGPRTVSFLGRLSFLKGTSSEGSTVPISVVGIRNHIVVATMKATFRFSSGQALLAFIPTELTLHSYFPPFMQ